MKKALEIVFPRIQRIKDEIKRLKEEIAENPGYFDMIMNNESRIAHLKYKLYKLGFWDEKST